MTDTMLVDQVELVIHRRTPEAGHLTATMKLPEAIQFADTEIAQGRAVILEIGSESLVVRAGREIVDFIRKVFGRGGERKQPTLTTISPMAGGEIDSSPDGAPAEGAEPVPMPTLPLRHRMDGGTMEAPRAMQEPGSMRRAAPDADIRAWTALVERIGERAARAMLAGGGYAVRSKLWPYVIYVVTPDIIKVINQGIEVSRICIVAQDGGSIWDAVHNRIQLLQAGEEGEIQVYATGQLGPARY